MILTDYETDEEGNYNKSNGKKKRQFIEYDDTDFTNDIRRDLETYNQLLRDTYVDIATLEEPFVVRTKKDGTAQRIKIDQSKKLKDVSLVVVIGTVTDGSMVGSGNK